MIKLRPYQMTKGVQYLRRNGGYGCLYWEMRLGKTIPVVRYLSQRSDIKRIFVVGPYSVLPGWKETVPDAHLIYGNTKEREEFFDNTRGQPGWYLINKEAHLHVDYLKSGFDAIVLDESFITNPKSQVTKYFLKYAKKAKARIILTGTPASESELQYWPQLQFINPAILEHTTYWKFRLERFRVEGFDVVMPIRHKIWLAKRLQKFCSILKRTDVGLNKEKIYEQRYVQLLRKNKKLYNGIEEDAMLNGEILKWAGQRWDKMRRLCSGEEKLKELQELINGELSKKRVVIYSWFVEEVERIAEVFSCPAIYGDIKKEKREEIRLNFQSGKTPILSIQPETIKTGSCFSNAEAAIFFSRPMGLATNEQVEERTEDLSTSDSTLVIDLIAENTIEEEIYTSIKLKESRVQALDRMRRALRNRNPRAV